MIDFSIAAFEHEGVGIAKLVEVGSDGVDIFSASKRFIQKLARVLHQKYGGEYRAHPQHFSFNAHSGKIIYRVNVIYRAPMYRQGTVIAVKNKLILVSSVFKDVVKGTDLISSKRVAVVLKDDSDVEVLASQELVVVQDKPDVFVQDPETYQPEEIVNATGDESVGDTLRVVQYRNFFYRLL